MRWKNGWVVFGLAGTVACGGANEHGAGTNAAGGANASSGGAISSGSNATASGTTGDEELRALLTETLTPQLCPKLLGSYVGLSGEGNARGPAAGNTPAAGRWWIRQCEARVVGDRLQLSMGGPGWIWVDREAMGFRIRQYVLFEADAQMSADVQLGYDRTHRIASLWMTHAEGATAHVTPRGVVSAEATGIFSSIVGAALPLTGASASDRAREQAGQIGSQMFAERLATGFTMTFSMATHQVDFMLGSLARGEVPERPFPSDTPHPWQANARTMVWPGGVDVIGPITVSEEMQGLDVELEEGPGASVRVVCASAMEPYFDARLRANGSTAVPPPSSGLIDLTPGSGVQHVRLPAVMTCPTLLLIAPRANSQLPARVRYRVAPVVASNDTTAAPAVPQRPQRVRIQVVSASIRPQNASNHDWDVIGGEADPYIVVASIPRGREVDRTSAIENNNNPSWNRWMPGAYELSADFPLRFSAIDEDGTTDEDIGSADLTVDAIATGTAASEIALPLRTTGAVPVQTGTLRLRVEPMP